MNDKQQVYCLNRQIDSKIARAAQLKKAGRLAEWAALEREIDSDIDRLVDMKTSRPDQRKEVLA